MFIVGIILFIAGVGSVFYGNFMNSDAEMQLASIFRNGTIDPGTIFVIAGMVAIAVGVVAIVLGKRKKK